MSPQAQKIIDIVAKAITEAKPGQAITVGAYFDIKDESAESEIRDYVTSNTNAVSHELRWVSGESPPLMSHSGWLLSLVFRPNLPPRA